MARTVAQGTGVESPWQSRSRLRWLPWLVIAVAAIACYAPTLAYGLVYDDDQIRESPLLARPFDVLAVWSNGFYPPRLQAGALYRPLYQWSLLLNWRANELLFGAGPYGPGFHSINVALHAAASLLLLAWLRALPLRAPIPFVAALLFAVHPIHSEAVANVAARSEPMMLCFGLAFLLAHRRGAVLPAALLYLLAMWSKESGALFLGVALVADFLFPGQGRALPLRRLALYAAVFGVWLALRALVLRGTVGETAFTDNPTVAATAVGRILTAAAVQLDYLRLLAWPLRQSIDYSFAHRELVESPFDTRVLAFAGVLAVAVCAAALFRRRAPVVALCVVGYALLFSVTSNFLFTIGTIQAERLAYAPSIFFCLLAAAALDAIRVRGSHLTAVLAGVLAVGLAAGLGALTLRQIRVWKDEATLYRDAVRTAPRSAKAHRNLGIELEREGDLRAAVGEYEESARIAPGYVYTWVALGNLRRRRGEMEAAVEAWRRALDIDPRFSDTRAELAWTLLDLSRRAEAATQAHELFARDVLHSRLPAIQDRLAEGASPEELHAARATLEAARSALSAGDAKMAAAHSQELAAGPALPRADRAQALQVLADAWERLGRSPRAGTYREAAQRLSGAPNPP